MRLSVVIPVYNGAAFLARCLASLQQSTWRDFECIVVDDGSTDDSRAVAAGHGASVLALDARGGPARARNRGAALARGEILMFLDADVCVHADTLALAERHLRECPGTDAVMGSYDDTPADPHLVSQYKNLFHHYVHHTSRTEAWTFWAGCGAIRRQVFGDLGGFDEAYAHPSIEDIELGYRLRARGYRIALDPRIQVTHLKRWTLRGLVRTDVLDRGVPWVLLMLQDRRMPADLNLRRTDRASVGLVFTMVLLCGVTLAGLMNLALPPSVARATVPLSVAAAATVMGLNRDLHRFFVAKRGWWFGVATVPLVWLYYGYCGVAAALGVGVFVWAKLTGRGARPGVPWARTAR